MKTVIIYCSNYKGNTRKIAKAMAEELSAQLLEVGELVNIDLTNYDLIGFGASINFARHNIRLLDFVEQQSLKGKNVFIFSTRCRPFLGRYHKAMKALLKKKQANLIGEYSCRGFDRTGPWVAMDGYNKNRPDAKDIFKARLFAAKMKSKVNSYSFASAAQSHQIIGNVVRLNVSTCVACGKCLRNCPMHVFTSYEKEKTYILPTTEQNCIQCSICAEACPTGSLFINESLFNGLRIAIKEVVSNKLQTAYLNRNIE